MNEKQKKKNDKIEIENSSIQTKKKRRFWQEDENNRLELLVKKFGTKKWKKISKFMKNRSNKQCRQRYLNYIKPKNNGKKWEDSEDFIIYLAWRLLGNRWKKFEKYLNGRTNRKIKNRFFVKISKQQLLFAKKLEKAYAIFQHDYHELRENYSETEIKLLLENFEKKGFCSQIMDNKRNKKHMNCFKKKLDVKNKNFNAKYLDLLRFNFKPENSVKKQLDELKYNSESILESDFKLDNLEDIEKLENFLNQNIFCLGQLEELESKIENAKRLYFDESEKENQSFMELKSEKSEQNFCPKIFPQNIVFEKRMRNLFLNF